MLIRIQVLDFVKRSKKQSVFNIEYKEKNETMWNRIFAHIDYKKQTNEKCKKCKYFVVCNSVSILYQNERKEMLTKIQEHLQEIMCKNMKETQQTTLNEINFEFEI